jgi:hypothetical protein
MKAAAVVADVVVLAAVAAAVAAAAAGTAAAGSVAGIGWTVGESTEARLQTWYEDSERPYVFGGRAVGVGWREKFERSLGRDTRRKRRGGTGRDR